MKNFLKKLAVICIVLTLAVPAVTWADEKDQKDAISIVFSHDIWRSLEKSRR